jgi:hypothetical protein
VRVRTKLRVESQPTQAFQTVSSGINLIKTLALRGNTALSVYWLLTKFMRIVEKNVFSNLNIIQYINAADGKQIQTVKQLLLQASVVHSYGSRRGCLQIARTQKEEP